MYHFSTTAGFRSARSALTCRDSVLMVGCLQRSSACRLGRLGLGWRCWWGFFPRFDEKKVHGRVFGRVCLANGSIASLCSGRISMVPAVAAAVHKVDLNGAAHDLDFEHYSHLLCLASAHSWTAVVSS